MQYPLVSICIPTYNGSVYIAEALQSALSQTYQNLEIVVSDDASTDETLAIVQSYVDKTDVPFRVVHHVPNGIGANWNNCIKNATGVYIKFLFQDDILHPTCVTELVSILEANPNLGLVGCKRDFIVTNTPSDEIKRWIDKYENLQQALK